MANMRPDWAVAVAKTKENGCSAVIAFRTGITTMKVSKETPSIRKVFTMDISNEELDRIAKADLEKLEYDIKGEAEAAVQDADARGDEGAAAAAAAVAAEADELMNETK